MRDRTFDLRPNEFDLEVAAQRAGERRLAYCQEILFATENEVDEEAIRLEYSGEEMAGPYCGCDTCIVREILDAAWPHLLKAAQMEARWTSVPSSSLP